MAGMTKTSNYESPVLETAPENRSLAAISDWATFSKSCPWRSEHYMQQELPERCTAIRQSAWLQECTAEKCAPFHFIRLLFDAVTK